MSASNHDGFTLLEVLVSFTILSAAIIFAFQISSSGLNTLRAAQERSREFAIVQAELTHRIASGSLEDGAVQGQTGAANWRIVTSALNESDTNQIGVRLHVVRAYGGEDRALIETIVME